MVGRWNSSAIITSTIIYSRGIFCFRGNSKRAEALKKKYIYHNYNYYYRFLRLIFTHGLIITVIVFIFLNVKTYNFIFLSVHEIPFRVAFWFKRILYLFNKQFLSQLSFLNLVLNMRYFKNYNKNFLSDKTVSFPTHPFFKNTEYNKFKHINNSYF